MVIVCVWMLTVLVDVLFLSFDLERYPDHGTFGNSILGSRIPSLQHMIRCWNNSQISITNTSYVNQTSCSWMSPYICIHVYCIQVHYSGWIHVVYSTLARDTCSILYISKWIHVVDSILASGFFFFLLRKWASFNSVVE